MIAIKELAINLLIFSVKLNSILSTLLCLKLKKAGKFTPADLVISE